MSRQHDGSTFRNFIDGVNEYDTLGDESVDNNFVMNNLVVAVHGLVKGSHHPRERLDGHLNASAESSWRGKEYLLHCHTLITD
jgi:hypothetical protein